MAYPSGTDSSYYFTVVHMFTTSDFGKTPGDTEVFTPDKVTNMAQGLQVVVTGLSPISVGWTGLLRIVRQRNKGRFYRYGPAGHREGVLVAALGRQLDLVPPAVGDGQSVQHIAKPCPMS